MDNTRTPVLYIVGNYNIDLVMGTLTHWPAQGTEMMLGAQRAAARRLCRQLRAGRRRHAASALHGRLSGRRRVYSVAGGTVSRRQRTLAAVSCETSLTVAITHPNKERSFLSNHGHITRLTAGDVLSQLPAAAGEGDIVLLCGTFLCTGLLSDYPQLLATLRQRGFTLAVDTGWPPQGWSDPLRHEVDRWLGDCDWLLLNDVETLQLAGHPTLAEAAAALAARLSGRGGCVVKRGADGADCWTTDGHHHAPTRPVTVIDTIGAGDSFNAGFLAALLSGKPAAAALRWGNIVAAQAIGTSRAAIPTGIPCNITLRRPPMASVELIDVAKRYGKQTVLQPLDLTIPDGSFTVLVGPSGCGKVDPAAPAGRSRNAFRRHHSDEQAAGQRSGSGRPRCGDGLSELRALPPPDGGGKSRLSYAGQKGG